MFGQRTHHRHRFRRDTALPGQGVVEFALASMVFLLIVFGTIDFGRAIFISAELHNAVREGTKVGRLDPTNTAAIKTAVVDHASGSGLTPGAVTVSCDGTCTTGNKITVSASVEFQAVTQGFLGISPITLRSSSSVDIE